MTLPKISFIYAYPLDAGRRKLFEEKNLGYYPTEGEVKETLHRWENLWNKKNTDNQIIKTLVDITKRVPYRALECFVFGGGINPISTPFLMPILTIGGEKRSDEDFLQTMIHELVHIFLSAFGDVPITGYRAMIQGKYSNESILTQNHILVYAMLQEVYDSLFKKLPPDFSNNDLPAGYMRAIQIVKEERHKNIIDEYYKFIG